MVRGRAKSYEGTKVLSYGIVLIKVIANKTLILNKRKGERFNNV